MKTLHEAKIQNANEIQEQIDTCNNCYKPWMRGCKLREELRDKVDCEYAKYL